LAADGGGANAILLHLECDSEIPFQTDLSRAQFSGRQELLEALRRHRSRSIPARPSTLPKSFLQPRKILRNATCHSE
jgi:hypothetical protein